MIRVDFFEGLTECVPIQPVTIAAIQVWIKLYLPVPVNF
jgi:hypothetical protein